MKSSVFVLSCFVFLAGCGGGNPTNDSPTPVTNAAGAPNQSANASATASGNPPTAELAGERSRLLSFISSYYKIGGQIVPHAYDLERFVPLTQSKDKEVSDLAYMAGFADLAYLGVEQADAHYFEVIKNFLGVDNNGRADPQRIAQWTGSFKERYDDVFNNSTQVSVRHLELDILERELLQHADAAARRWAGNGGFDPSDLKIKATSRWRVTFRNRSSHELKNVTLSIVYKMPPAQRANPILNRIVANMAATTGGETDPDEIARKAVAFHDSKLADDVLQQSAIQVFIHISAMAAGQEAETVMGSLPTEHPVSATYSLWGSRSKIENLPLPGFDEIQGASSRQQSERDTHSVATPLKPGSSDLFTKGSVWQGDKVKLVVNERHGQDFTGVLFGGQVRLRKVIGTIVDGAVTWHGAPGEARPGSENIGVINGKSIEMRYVLPYTPTRELSGYFQLEYVSSK